MITSTHLKKHQITTKEYKEQYGTVVSQNYRNECSKRNLGKNNPNYGNKMCEASRKKISEARKGKAPHNKGVPMPEEQKAKLSMKTKERNKIWRETNTHPIIGIKRTKETREKIKKKRKQQVIKSESIYKGIETKRSRGYDLAFFRGRKHTLETKKKISQKAIELNKERTKISIETARNRIAVDGYKINGFDKKKVIITCKHNHSFMITQQYTTKSKYRKELCPVCYPRDTVCSAGEIEVRDFLSKYTTVLTNTRKMISPLELDIYLPEFNLAVEYNGLYWHSEQYREKNYHLNKSLQCEEKGIKLIHIFEDEWLFNRKIVESRLLSSLGMNKKIYARNCDLVELTSKEANKFLKENHIQGSGRSNLRYGLRYRNDLVAVMTFLKGDKSKSLKGWELNRYASLIEFNVVGGASKLFKHFQTTIKPTCVTSFADLRWSMQSKFYEKLGFTFFHNSPPNYWYFLPNEVRRIHRFALRKPTGSMLTERELRESEGYMRIYDCGSAKYIWGAE